LLRYLQLNVTRQTMLKKAWDLYYNGFKEMPQWGRKLWLIIIVKLGIMFLVFKLFLMPNYLNRHFDSPEAKSEHVFQELTTKSK